MASQQWRMVVGLGQPVDLCIGPSWEAILYRDVYRNKLCGEQRFGQSKCQPDLLRLDHR